MIQPANSTIALERVIGLTEIKPNDNLTSVLKVASGILLKTTVAAFAALEFVIRTAMLIVAFPLYWINNDKFTNMSGVTKSAGKTIFYALAALTAIYAAKETQPTPLVDPKRLDPKAVAAALLIGAIALGALCYGYTLIPTDVDPQLATKLTDCLEKLKNSTTVIANETLQKTCVPSDAGNLTLGGFPTVLALVTGVALISLSIQVRKNNEHQKRWAELEYKLYSTFEVDDDSDDDSMEISKLSQNREEMKERLKAHFEHQYTKTQQQCVLLIQKCQTVLYGLKQLIQTQSKLTLEKTTQSGDYFNLGKELAISNAHTKIKSFEKELNECIEQLNSASATKYNPGLALLPGKLENIWQQLQ